VWLCVLLIIPSKYSLRKTLLPHIRRQYAGYVSWRRTVPEEAVDEQASEEYAEKVDFHLMDRNYIL
jgi:hypothetical protein